MKYLSILKFEIYEIEHHNFRITVEITSILKTKNENCISIVE